MDFFTDPVSLFRVRMDTPKTDFEEGVTCFSFFIFHFTRCSPTQLEEEGECRIIQLVANCKRTTRCH